VAALGKWQLEIKSAAVPEGGDIHAWIERTPGVPSAFLDHMSEEMTLSIPGTAASVIAVGAVEAAEPIAVGTFSSYGPTRDGQRKPLVCAPGVDINAANGGTSNGARRESGTSMAAPHVTGAIALVLSRKAKAGPIPSGSQIASALRKTRNYSGRWDRGQGYGVVDTTALLAAFE
jgi:endonuclease G